MTVDFLRVLAAALLLAGCGGSLAKPDAPGDGPGHIPGMPGLGAHGMSDYHLQDTNHPGARSISTPVMTTQSSGSTIIVSVGRGEINLFAVPTDNKGNSPYLQQGSTQTYPSYPNSGTAVYTFTSAVGGSNFQVSTTTGKDRQGRDDEITIAAVEIVESSQIHAFAWNKLDKSPLTSDSVTTTGPATLVAFWWGDGFPGTPQSATPNNGFEVVDSNAQELDSFVQCVVAVKNVTAAGTYDVTWTPMPEQGAQLWLVAVQ